MDRITADTLDEILKIGSKNDFLIFGEIHGSAQNASLLKEVIDLFTRSKIDTILALEWAISSHELESINKYLLGQSEFGLIPEFFFNSDGRVTPEHIELLRGIKENNCINSQNSQPVRIVTFENEKNSSSEAELADALLYHKKQNINSLIVVETGNFHARKYCSENDKSMALLLAEHYKVYSILIKYLRGKVAVDGEAMDVTQAFSQKKSYESFFDGVLEIPTSSVAGDMYPLQSIKMIL